MDELTGFRDAFGVLTSHQSFPWQDDLYMTWFSQGNFPPSCSLPTGLGKTSVVAIWLIALANQPEKLPRRLVYVVNRRTVVDQTTEEVLKYRRRIANLNETDVLRRRIGSLAISTLRGQFADNREWSADPSRPAVIVGTVDMIGSRLLFSGYGVGFKAKPLHAGFLGQDVLLVHDEAHLEPAFQDLLTAIRKEQERCKEFRKFHVMELSATWRGVEEPFELTRKERNPPEVIPDPPTKPVEVVWRRLKARKGILFLKPESDKEKVADRIGKLAKKYSESHAASAVLVFVNSLEDHATVCKALKGEQVQVLTGTLRGLERDRMADPRKGTGCPIFARFLKPPKPDDDVKEQWKITPTPGPVYLVCTSAGEVGIDISADHMVCDLTTFDRVVQRFGRVNRFGAGDANIDIVHEATPDKKKDDDPNEQARWNTLALLKELPQIDERRSASPLALMQLRQREDLNPKFQSAYTPHPTILPVSEILFDAWALTTIRGKLPGRPPVEPYLHGLSGWEPPETHVAWRDEVDVITGDLLEQYGPEDLLEDYPLKPQELLRDRSGRVFRQLAAIAEREPNAPVWLLDDDGNVEVVVIGELTDKDNRDRINYRTVLLPPNAGGLRGGFLDGDSSTANDVADDWRDEAGNPRRVRVWDDDPQFDEKTKAMRLIRTIDTNPDADEADQESHTAGRRYWHWYEAPKAADNEGSKAGQDAVLWHVHTGDVVSNATQMAERLPLSDDLRNAVILAARFHDLGKKRALFQRILGNMNPDILLAKSGRRKNPFRLAGDYRHEFGSLLDVENEPEFQQLSDEMKELVRHLTAAHHGRGRPHFPLDEAFDPEPKGKNVSMITAEVPQRFARLQRKYGRWGLAYLESLLRAADYAASAKPSAVVGDDR
jgi:CRISPR-associated endonuclease/helicase Cas3